ncbi:hypothetical protein C8R46DRAFT_1098450 [Mycena filopes]|nr:hypothetical protein C8R46DRAFT_1098450 [Mycena filopes]
MSTVEHMKAEILAWQSALEAQDAGDFRAAIRLFEPIADTSKILFNIALLHDRLGERGEAISKFSEALELDGYLAVGYFQRGVAYFHCQEYDKALLDFSAAQDKMRANLEINYEVLGLDYKLKLREIQFNKWLTLRKLGSKESALLLQTLIEAKPPREMVALIDAERKSPGEATMLSMPLGTLYRPSASKIQLLNAAEAMEKAPASLPSMYTASSDTSSTFLPSVSSRKGGHRKYKSSSSSSYRSSAVSEEALNTIPKRAELNRVVGADMTKPVTEFHSIPCAGVRLTHGALSGLMAWRFFVTLDYEKRSSNNVHMHPAVITNFILDTGDPNTYVPADALTALGYRGDITPGAEVTLRIQSVKTRCIVANAADAGRVGLSFMTAGSLTYYFDAGLVAPVLYDGSKEKPQHVPRTIRAEDLPGWSLSVLRSKIWAILTFSRASA